MNADTSARYVPDDYGWLQPPAVPYTRGAWTWEQGPRDAWTAHDLELRPLFRIERLAGTASDLARLQAADGLHAELTRLALLVRDYLDVHDGASACADPACRDTLETAVLRAEALLRRLPPDMRTGEISRTDLQRAS